MKRLFPFALLICYCLIQPNLSPSGNEARQLSPTPARLTRSALIGPFPGSARLLAAQQPPQDETWRSHPPAPKAAAPLKLPLAREIALPNGLTLIVVEDHRAPIVTFDIAVPVGEIDDPPRQTGLAEATADLLTEGAGGLTSHQLAAEVEKLGGLIASSSSPDYSEISATVLAENAGRMIEIAGDILLRPSFPEEEVALYKNTRLEKLTVQRQDPAFIVSEEFNKVIYGPHPYSASAPTPESVSGMNRSRIREFYNSTFGPDGSYIVAVGDFDPSVVESRFREIFGGWKSRPRSASHFPSPPVRTEKTIYLIDRPGSDQADIRIGNLAVRRASPDFTPLLVANAILGAGTSSRLFLNVREQKGYTYDVSSSLAALKQYGTFFGATETRNEVCAQAITEILAEFDRIRNEKVSSDELQNAKNYIIGNLSLLLSTQAGLASQILRARLFALGSDFLQTVRSRVDGVTADQVTAAARAHILTDHPAIVVVGDAARLKKSLESIAPVVVLRRQVNPAK